MSELNVFRIGVYIPKLRIPGRFPAKPVCAPETARGPELEHCKRQGLAPWGPQVKIRCTNRL